METTKEINIEVLAERIKELPTQTIVMLVNDINRVFKKSKKSPLTSGRLFFNDYCKKIAETLNTPSKKELIFKYRLA